MGELTALRSGTVAIGILGEPSAWRLDRLVATFLDQHPEVSIRLVGRNSSAVVERVRRGELEAGIVLLPIDDDYLDVRPIVRDEVLYAADSQDPIKVDVWNEPLATVSGDYDTVPRALPSPFIERWQREREQATQNRDDLRDEIVEAIEAGRFGELMPFTGQSAGLIHDLQPAADIVRRLAFQATTALERSHAAIRSPSPSPTTA